MELTAALESLKYIAAQKITGTITLHTDSAYVLQGITGWVYGWEKNGWKTKEGEPVLNQDIWKELAPLAYRLKELQNLTWVKVSGHAGVAGNERVDEIATMFADGERPLLFSGARSEYEKLLGDMLVLTENSVATKKKSSNKSTAYSYVSLVDGSVVTDPTWALCEKRVKGKKGAKFKKVFSKEEEETLKAEWSR
jgi:ribonuclease HI